MSRWPYRPGDFLAICDICGFRAYGSELLKNYLGLRVHERCYEERHPQETIRHIKEKITVQDPRPEATPTYLDPGDVTIDDL